MEGTTETTITPGTTTTETPSAAPATSAPSASGDTGQRPTNVRELASLMEKLDTSAAATPQEPASTEETAATGQDATATATGATTATTKQGPIPFEVHSKALENARTKAATEAVAKYREQHGWAESIPRETIQQWSGIAQRMAADPIAFLSEFQAEIANHPTYGPQLRSHAARTLAGGRQAQADLSPDLVVDAGDGRQIATFSAERVQQIVQRSIQDALAKEVGPIKQEREQRLAQQQKADEEVRQLNAKADEQIAFAKRVIGDETNEAAWAAVHKAMSEDPTLSLHDAALKVRDELIVAPKLQKEAQAKVVASHKQKAAGNTGTGNVTGTVPQRPTNARELAKWMELHA